MRPITERLADTLTLLAVIAALAGCGGATSATANLGAGAPQAAGQTPTATGPSTVDTGSRTNDTSGACSLLTTAEVAAATGRDMTTTSGAGAICIYQGSDPSKPFSLMTYSNQQDMAAMLQIEPGSLHIDGVGTDAFYTKVGGILFARNDDHALSFTDLTVGLNNPGQPPPDALVQLAKTVLAKL
jgi:hypothetical protein